MLGQRFRKALQRIAVANSLISSPLLGGRVAQRDAPIIGNMVSYVAEVAQAANGATEGLYAASSFYVPDFRAAEPGSWLANWYEEYVSRFGEEPAPQSIIGYTSADLVVRALEAAGPDLTVIEPGFDTTVGSYLVSDALVYVDHDVAAIFEDLAIDGTGRRRLFSLCSDVSQVGILELFVL